MKPNPQIVKFLEKKIKILNNLKKTSFIIDNVINFSILAINVTILILAGIVLFLELEATLKDNSYSHTFLNVIDKIGFSTVFALVIILLFIINIILAIKKNRNTSNRYRKIFKDFENVIVRVKNEKEFTLEEVKIELNQIETRYTIKNKLTLKETIKDILTKSKVN